MKKTFKTTIFGVATFATLAFPFSGTVNRTVEPKLYSTVSATEKSQAKSEIYNKVKKLEQNDKKFYKNIHEYEEYGDYMYIRIFYRNPGTVTKVLGQLGIEKERILSIDKETDYALYAIFLYTGPMNSDCE